MVVMFVRRCTTPYNQYKKISLCDERLKDFVIHQIEVSLTEIKNRSSLLQKVEELFYEAILTSLWLVLAKSSQNKLKTLLMLVYLCVSI